MGWVRAEAKLAVGSGHYLDTLGLRGLGFRVPKVCKIIALNP